MTKLKASVNEDPKLMFDIAVSESTSCLQSLLPLEMKTEWQSGISRIAL